MEKLNESQTGAWSDKLHWGRATSYVFSDAAARIAAENSFLQDKARREAFNRRFQHLLISKIKFNEATFDTAVERLRQQAEKSSGGVDKVNVVMLLPRGAAQARTVTLELNNTPFPDALRYICDLGEAEFTIETHAIVISGAGKAARPRAGAITSRVQQPVTNLIIPKIALRQATFSDALESLRQQVARLSGGAMGVNFVFQKPGADGPNTITLNMEAVPFLEALGYICELADATFSVEKYAIVISGAKTPNGEEAKNTP